MLLCLGLQQRNDLDGLSKAHIVGQNAAKSIYVQRFEPAVAGLLITAQHLLQRRRNHIVAVFHGLHTADHGPKQIIPVKGDAIALF